MGYYSTFPWAIPLHKAGCIRVTHPSATRQRPEGPVTVRLACVKPPASVHPEPGSNSPLYIMFIFNILRSEKNPEINKV